MHNVQRSRCQLAMPTQVVDTTTSHQVWQHLCGLRVPACLPACLTWCYYCYYCAACCATSKQLLKRFAASQFNPYLHALPQLRSLDSPAAACRDCAWAAAIR